MFVYVKFVNVLNVQLNLLNVEKIDEKDFFNGKDYGNGILNGIMGISNLVYEYKIDINNFISFYYVYMILDIQKM